MIHLQDVKFVSITPPAAKVDAGSFTTAAVDTLGYRYVTIVCYLGDTDIAMSALKVQESEDSGMSGAEDIDELVVGTANNIDGVASALPSATDDNKFVVFEIDMRGRKRYLDLVATAGDGSTGTFMAAMAILSRPEISPISISERGCDEILRA